MAADSPCPRDRTHGQVIAVRAAIDRAALAPLPSTDYLVSERHLRSVAKDCLVSFEASLYSVPASAIRRPMKVELRVTSNQVFIHRLESGELLATHPRARVRGTWVVDESHWAGLPDGTRELRVESPVGLVAPRYDEPAMNSTRSRHVGVVVAKRQLSFYDTVGVAS
ncbi:MAG TPA: hypothetical protein PLG60_08545 [Acidimicrobiales bacterium]|nr:hypothetical protein [Acidimicrobiales bacterium]